MLKLKLSLTFMFLAVCFLAFGQKISEKNQILSILEASQKKYDSIDQFQTKVEYRLFSTYTTSKAKEVYSGVIVKKNQEFYSKINHTELVTLKNLSLKIDHELKLMQVIFSKPQNNDLPIESIKNLLHNFNSFKIETIDMQYRITMVSPKISFVPYYKVIVFINKNDFTFTKQELYLIEKANYKTNDGTVKKDYPKLVIEFEALNSSISEFLHYFNNEYYINSKGNKAIPTQNYSQFTIVD